MDDSGGQPQRQMSLMDVAGGVCSSVRKSHAIHRPLFFNKLKSQRACSIELGDMCGMDEEMVIIIVLNQSRCKAKTTKRQSD